MLFGKKKPHPKVRRWTWRLAFRERTWEVLTIVGGYLAGAEAGQQMVLVAVDDLQTIQSDINRAREVVFRYAK